MDKKCIPGLSTTGSWTGRHAVPIGGGGGHTTPSRSEGVSLRRPALLLLRGGDGRNGCDGSAGGKRMRVGESSCRTVAARTTAKAAAAAAAAETVECRKPLHVFTLKIERLVSAVRTILRVVNRRLIRSSADVEIVKLQKRRNVLSLKHQSTTHCSTYNLTMQNG